MTDKNLLFSEIETLPPQAIDEIYTFVGYLKVKMNVTDDITLASESALAKDWLLPEENIAWEEVNKMKKRIRAAWLERLEAAVDLAQNEDFPDIERDKTMRPPLILAD